MANDPENDPFPDFDLAQHRQEDPVDRKPIALWIPISHHAKFEELQGRSGKAYGRYLQKMIIESIDKVSKKHGI